ncbi:MAG: CpaF family protein, partial [Candidatus Moranbacteria bacterium]|nr:CpaF family protein [Candidatus Moranbacteria bacterium]
YMADFLDSAIKARLNILICGGAGSGKTTLLNILSSSIPDDERIITIEDAAELKLKQEHVISLETRNNNYEENGEVSVRDLLINSLRMRPDRIIIGEVRGKEAFDMLQAMNTGHEGSITTLHANSSKDALNRLESMVLMSNIELPIKAIREYIVNTIDLVVHVERLSDGKRKIMAITEIDDLKDDVIETKDIFGFNINGITQNKEVDGEFIKYDMIPKCLNKFHSKGIFDVDFMFNK